jgi:hypothetical protein
MQNLLRAQRARVYDVHEPRPVMTALNVGLLLTIFWMAAECVPWRAAF